MASPFTPATIPSSGFTGGTVSNAVTIDTTTDPAFVVKDGAGHNLLAAQQGSSILRTTAGAQLTVSSSAVKYEADDGTDIVIFGSTGQVQLSPEDGQVDALAGVLRLAANSAPADATLFNGSFVLWLDTGVPALKVKAKVSGSFVTATIPLA